MRENRYRYAAVDLDGLRGIEADVIAHAMERANDGLLYDVDGERMTAAEAAYRVYQQRNELRRVLDDVATALRRIADTERMRAMTPSMTVPPDVAKSEVCILSERLDAVLGRAPSGTAG